MNISSSTCLNCDKPIKVGRIDKRFCGEGCKNTYNNNQKRMEREEIKKIDLALKNNRRILKKILEGKQEETISKEALYKAGFDFDYHSHFITSKIKNHQYIFCYNYGYRQVEGEKIKVVKSFK